MQEFYIKSPTGPVHCCQWIPEGTPVGVIQIIHGIKEYAARYGEFARTFAAQGYLVVGADHPGHGKSVPSGEKRGYLSGGWVQTVNNIRRLFLKTRREYPDIPYIMFGHSMGSFLLTTYLTVYREGVDAVILSGSGWQPDPAARLGRALCKAQALRVGDKKSSPLILNLMFGMYNKKFAPSMSAYDWLCSDAGVVKKYIKDPMCKWEPSIQMCYEMLRGIIWNQQTQNLRKIKENLPVFFISGQMDPVGSYGNGVLKMVQVFKNTGMTDVLVELYPNMRHECHNEFGKEKVYTDVLDWLREKTSISGKGCNL